MKFILRRYFYKVLIVCIVFIMLINVAIKYKQAFENHRSSLNFGLNQVIEGLEKVDRNRENYEKKLKAGYIERANTLAGLLKENPKIIKNSKELERLAKLINIDEINVIDKNGIIVGSSVERYVGYNMNEGKQSKEFMKLINSKDNFFFQETQPNSFEKTLRSYVGVKRLDSEGILQLGLVPERLIEYRQQNSFEKILGEYLTKNGIFLLILDMEKNEIISSSKLEIDIENFLKENSSKVVKKLKEEREPTIKIANKKYSGISKEYRNYLVVFMSSEHFLYDNIKWHMLSLFCGMLLIFVMIIVSLNTFINRKILKDIDYIVAELVNKDSKKIDIKLDRESIKELKKISESINKMYKNLFQLTFQINSIFNLGTINIGIFEYNKVLDRVFITDSILNFLDVTKTEWENFIKEKDFKDRLYLKLREQKIDSELGIYKLGRDKYIRIVFLENEEEIFGIAQDITKEYKERITFLNDLQTNENLANIDGLTNLLNRRAFKYLVEKNISSIKQGVLILFDLDNFKKVNDNEGHPVGDKVLVKFSKILKKVFENEKGIARLGGDEFGIFLEREISSIELKNKLEEVFKFFRKELEYYFIKYNLSTSIGADFILESDIDYTTLYLRVDSKLYNAKYKGKNKYEL